MVQDKLKSKHRHLILAQAPRVLTFSSAYALPLKLVPPCRVHLIPRVLGVAQFTRCIVLLIIEAWPPADVSLDKVRRRHVIEGRHGLLPHTENRCRPPDALLEETTRRTQTILEVLQSSATLN